MKTYVKIVRRCWEGDCPHCISSLRYNDGMPRCRMMREDDAEGVGGFKPIPREDLKDGFPAWCPLSDMTQEDRVAAWAPYQRAEAIQKAK